MQSVSAPSFQEMQPVVGRRPASQDWECRSGGAPARRPTKEILLTGRGQSAALGEIARGGAPARGRMYFPAPDATVAGGKLGKSAADLTEGQAPRRPKNDITLEEGLRNDG